jgi:hypothetical protein
MSYYVRLQIVKGVSIAAIGVIGHIPGSIFREIRCQLFNGCAYSVLIVQQRGRMPSSPHTNDLPRRCCSLGKSKKSRARSDTDFDTRDRLKMHSRAILCELTH